MHFKNLLRYAFIYIYFGFVSVFLLASCNSNVNSPVGAPTLPTLATATRKTCDAPATAAEMNSEHVSANKTEPKNISVDSLYFIDTTAYTIYLTFDDGPLQGSDMLNEILLKNKIKANAFVVGDHIVKNKRMRSFYDMYLNNPFIEVANHSTTHALNRYNDFYGHPQRAAKDILKTEQYIPNTKKIVRLPGRNMWRSKNIYVNDVNLGSQTADILQNNGYTIMGWDVHWQHDNCMRLPLQTAPEILYEMRKYLITNRTITKNHVILLCHDEMFREEWSKNELQKLITLIKKQMPNAKFNHLSQYPVPTKLKKLVPKPKKILTPTDSLNLAKNAWQPIPNPVPVSTTQKPLPKKQTPPPPPTDTTAPPANTNNKETSEVDEIKDAN